VSDDKRTHLGTGPAITPAPAAPAPSAPADVDPLLGKTLAGRYLIIRKLGEGGMGAVYLATHTALEKQVALKVLHGELGRKPDLVERFIQEAKAASRIRHENVIDISDFGKTDDGYVFFAMELLTGHDLHDEIARARIAGMLLPWSRTKKIFLQICAALAAAHARGIIHRDLKPENVYLVDFLGDTDFVKLLDFGIAKLTEVSEPDRKLTRTGMLFGTPEYMSPEQARGEAVDARVDVYAMGCILFQLVTGRVPFETDNFMGVLSLHLTQPPPAIAPDVFDRIGAPRELARVIERALAKDRDGRYQTIDELANAVREVCHEPPVAVAARAPSVQAPAVTTVTPSTTSGLRQRTQWTGNLSVPPAEDAAPPAGRSKLPLAVAAGLVVAGGAIAVAIALTRGDGETPAPAPAAAPPTIAAATPVDAAPAATTAALPESLITIESTPRDANIVDLTTNESIGKTPLTFRLKGSHDPRRFQLALAGYQDLIVELVPDSPKQVFAKKLVKVVAGVKPQRPGSTIAAPPPPPPDDKEDCEDPPCIKTKIPGLRGGSGSGSATPPPAP
jgi:eukaryotic-like serine/threonine-protein kinase